MAGIAVGMNIDDVRALATALTQGAEEIRTLVSSLTNQIDTTDWRGNDSDSFKEEWHGQHAPSLNHVVSALEHASQVASSNAQAQELASA